MDILVKLIVYKRVNLTCMLWFVIGFEVSPTDPS